ncbi:MFS family permease [Bradyrhizobium sp. LM4.3]
MCIGQVGNLLPHVTLSANLAQHLMPAWGLSAAEGGLMASGYAFGYMLAVPVLTTLTDRIDARLVLLCGSILSGLATLAFGIFAQGFWSATAIWSLAGLGFAGAYMPGLKALTDRLPAGDTSRAVTLYTSSFSVGVGLSFLVAQIIADEWGWRTAFLVTGFGPIAMVVACLLMQEQRPAPKTGRLLNFAPVFANREALGYIFGYGAHCFELYGIRTWLVGFWTFVISHQGAPSWLSPVVLSFCFAVISMPASILGNEAALKFGRHRAITIVMIASACVGLVIGLNATAPVMAARAAADDLWPDGAGRFRRVDRRHVGRCSVRSSRRDPGLALHRWLWAVSCRRLGYRRRARRSRRPAERQRLAAGVHCPLGRDRGGSTGAALGAGATVPEPQREMTLLAPAFLFGRTSPLRPREPMFCRPRDRRRGLLGDRKA